MTIDYGGQKTRFKCEISTDGRWALDHEIGKALMFIELTDVETNKTLKYFPTHDDVCLILKRMLDVEIFNDSYTFKNPTLELHRPKQTLKKIERIYGILEEYVKSLPESMEVKMGCEILTENEREHYIKCLKEARDIVGESGDQIVDAILISAVFLRLSSSQK